MGRYCWFSGRFTLFPQSSSPSLRSPTTASAPLGKLGGRRKLTQHGVLPCLAGGWRWFVLWWAGRIACPAKELISCELMANPAAAAAGLLLIVHKTPPWAKSHKEGRVRHSVHSMTAPWFQSPASYFKEPLPATQREESLTEREGKTVIITKNQIYEYLFYFIRYKSELVKWNSISILPIILK